MANSPYILSAGTTAKSPFREGEQEAKEYM
jgi:hypothetical protein